LIGELEWRSKWSFGILSSSDAEDEEENEASRPKTETKFETK
jgi:hypothetical protein